jgi:hypothetical protein
LPLGQLPDGEPGAALGQLRPACEHRSGIGQLDRDPVQADAGETELRSGGERRVAHQDYVVVAREDIASPLGEAPFQADVHRPGQVGDGESAGSVASRQN